MKAFFHLSISLLMMVGLSFGDDLVNERYIEFPNAVPGKILKTVKRLDAGDGKVKVGVILDGMESGMSLTALEEQEQAVVRAMTRPLSRELSGKLATIGQNSKVKVAIHLKFPPFNYPDKTQVSQGEAYLASVSASVIQPLVSLPVFFLRHGLLGLSTRGSNILEGELKRHQIEALKSDADIGSIELLTEEDLMSPELTTLAPSAYNPGGVPSGAGSGVKAATFENGLTSGFLSCIGVTPAAYDANVTGVNWEIRHANGVFRCLVSAAPSASFYHRRTSTFDGTNDVNYLINNGIQTVSMSATRGGTSPYHSTNSEFLVMDDFAYRYPYPVFITGTANSGYSYEANWQLYNGISVGNVRHTGNSTYELADCTQTKNPPPVYGSCISGSGSNCAGDREMPYVVVPGTPYTGSDFASTCLEGAGTVNCGTSWSVGIGNGIAADLIAADSRLASWPEKVRAAMILTSHNVDGGHWSSGTDGRDGSGTVSGADGVSFAQTHTSVSPGNSACEKGMGASSLYASDFGAGNKRFNYYVPNPKPSGKHLRVVLTWDSNPVVGGGVNALSDLDLIVQNSSSTQGSYSWDGNVEVVDVAAGDLSAGSSYYIDISPAINRIPSSGSRANYIYYSIAWAWVKDHAD
jgi:hypothetical protein